MTTKNFNAKKMLMSTVAAVVFSFVFATNADASSFIYTQEDNTEVQKGSDENSQENTKEDNQGEQEENENVFIYILHKVFGVRV